MAPTIEIDGHKIALSNTDKILFPEAKVTKGDLIDYYRNIAPTMLPHIAGRPLSFQRYPDGIEAGGFMQKNAVGLFSGLDPARAPRQGGRRGRPRRRRGRRDPGLSRQPGLRHPARRALPHRPDRPS